MWYLQFQVVMVLFHSLRLSNSVLAGQRRFLQLSVLRATGVPISRLEPDHYLPYEKLEKNLLAVRHKFVSDQTFQKSKSYNCYIEI